MSVVRFRPEAPICGCSSSGRAPPCQGGGSEFEPRHPLQVLRQSRNRLSFFCRVCKSGIENPRRLRLRGFSFVLTEQTYIFKCEQHTHMRIATAAAGFAEHCSALATRAYMRIATKPHRQQNLISITGNPHSHAYCNRGALLLSLPTATGNPHSHAYCNGDFAEA